MSRLGDFALLLVLASLVAVEIVDAKVVLPSMPKKMVVAPAQAAAAAKEAAVKKVGRWDAHDPGYFTDDFARRKMFPLAAAAYSDDPNQCVNRHFENATVTMHIKSECVANDKQELCAGFVGVSHSHKAIIVSFRGTDGFLELVIEIDDSILKSKQPSPIGGKVGLYFHDVFQHLWDKGLGSEIERLLNEYPDYEVWTTGHSLGGAVGSIAAGYILNTYNLESERIKLVTFGQPRTGDTEYAEGHNKRLPRSYRVVHKRDIVPHIPPKDFENYWHHESEVWYPNNMKPGDSFVVCNDGENSKDCSAKLWFDVSVSDHLHYFGKHMPSYGVDGCIDPQKF